MNDINFIEWIDGTYDVRVVGVYHLDCCDAAIL